MIWFVVALLACRGEPDAGLYARAIADGVLPDDAIAACERVRAPDIRDECLATVVRMHGLDGDVCDDITDERWRGECWFSLAERLGKEGDRWGALEGCGHSGPFYGECLYHQWTAELSAVAQAAAGPADAVPEARPIVAFWSNLQTIAGDPEEQLWGDFWFFAHNEHRPADLSVCEGLAADVRCLEGTRVFVLRALLGQMLAPGQSPDLLDRICRSGQIPSLWVNGLFVSHPDLNAQVDRAAVLACDAAAGKPVRRWNPVFQPRHQPQEGAPVPSKPPLPGDASAPARSGEIELH